MAAAFHPCRSELELATASKVDEIIAQLTFKAPLAPPGSSRSHLIELEQDIRTLVGVIATSHD